MKKLLQLIAVAVLGLGVATTGLVAADTAEVDTTGPDSTVTIDFAEDYDARVDNTANVRLAFDNVQNTDTGSAMVNRNTGGGSAMTGAAESMSDVAVEGEIDNTEANAVLAGNGGGDENEASVSNTGPDSRVRVDFNNTTDIRLNNSTTLNISNNNRQASTSGDAEVRNNTEGGDAESGDSTSSSTSSFSFTVRN